MKKALIRTISNPLVSGSGIVFVGSMAANVLSYAFNLTMGRVLSVSDYGLLIALTSFFALFSIFRGTISKIIARYAAVYHAKKDDSSLYSLYAVSAKYSLIFSLSLFVILISMSILIMKFLLIGNFTLLVFVTLAISSSILMSAPQGLMQGLLRFNTSSFFIAFPPLIKLGFGLVFIYLGFGISGVLFGLFLSTAIPALILYKILASTVRVRKKSKKVDEAKLLRIFLNYGSKYFMAALGMALLANTDILLVRYFLKEFISGQYAALTIMGKAIFYLTMPIGFVFFPLIAYKKERKEGLFNTIMFAAGFITLASVSLSFVYFVFPKAVLGIFFPAQEYKALASYLGPYSLYIYLFSLVSLLQAFFLSIGKAEIYKITLAGAAFQIIMLSFFHNSFHQVIGVLFLSSLLVLFSYMIYYFKYSKDSKLLDKVSQDDVNFKKS